VSICAVQTEDTFRRFLMERDGTVGGHDKAHYYDHVADEEPPPPESWCAVLIHTYSHTHHTHSRFTILTYECCSIFFRHSCICATMIMRVAGAAFPHTALLVETGTVDKDVMFSNAQKKLVKMLEMVL
jgi:hypothetical protein